MEIARRIFQYAYLVFAGFFFYQAYQEYSTGGTKTVFMILLGIAALGMFFFRLYFNKKFNQRR